MLCLQINLRIDVEDVTNIFIPSIDGTHCSIKEPRLEPSRLWYSHKLNKPGVAYEIAIDVFENKVAWINGPFKAGESDLSIFQKENGLKSKIPPGKLLIADKGYIGEAQFSTPYSFDEDVLKDFKARVQARHENFNGRIKECRVLSERFRSHRIEAHGTVFTAVCVLVQYSMENGRPLIET